MAENGNGSKMGRILGGVVTVGGGALAGALDAKYPAKKPGGFTLGTVVGVGAAIVGLTKLGGSKYSKYAMQIGEGALAYEAGRIAAARVSAPSASSGVVGALGAKRRSVTQSEFDRSMAMLRNAA